jgi:hypothetical protein
MEEQQDLRRIVRRLRRTHDDEIERRPVEQRRQHIFCSSRPRVLNNAVKATSGRNIDLGPSFLRNQFQHLGQS